METLGLSWTCLYTRKYWNSMGKVKESLPGDSKTIKSSIAVLASEKELQKGTLL